MTVRSQSKYLSKGCRGLVVEAVAIELLFKSIRRARPITLKSKLRAASKQTSTMGSTSHAHQANQEASGRKEHQTFGSLTTGQSRQGHVLHAAFCLNGVADLKSRQGLGFSFLGLGLQVLGTSARCHVFVFNRSILPRGELGIPLNPKP